jgi:hypothetical protein
MHTMKRGAVAGVGLLATLAACNAVLSNNAVGLWQPNDGSEAGQGDGGVADVSLDAGIDWAVGPDVEAGSEAGQDAQGEAATAESGSGADSGCGDAGCITCPAGSMPCGGSCAHVTSDNQNCGACGNVCLTSAGQSCVSGSCTPPASLLVDREGYVLDDPDGGGAGTGLDQTVYVGPNPNQEWIAQLVTAGQYKILAANGLALTGSSSACGQVSIQSFKGTSDQLWQLAANGSYTNIISVASGLALDDNGGVPSVVNCAFGSTNANQMWTLTSPGSVAPLIADGAYAFTDGAGFALDDPGASTTGTIDQEPYGGKNQQWTVTRVSGIQYEIVSPSGLALTGSATQCGQVALASYTGAANQRWVFQANGTRYNVLNVESGWALDQTGAGGQGVAVRTCYFYGNDGSQVWTINASVPAGTYEITNFGGFALDDPDGGAGTVPDQGVYVGANEQWTVTNITALEYEISSASGDVLTSGTTSGQIAGLSSYTGASDQLWTFSPTAGRYSLVNVGTGLFLDANGGGPGTPCHEWPWANNSNQSWNLTAKSSVLPPLSNGLYSFVNVTGSALDDPSGGGAGTVPDEVAYAGAAQNWTVMLVGTSAYKILGSSGYALTSSASKGQIAGLSTYTGNADQLWNFAANGRGTYYVINVGTGLLLDDNGTGAGACDVWTWVGTTNSNQVWSLVAE